MKKVFVFAVLFALSITLGGAFLAKAQFPTPVPAPPEMTQTIPSAPAPVIVAAAPKSPNADLFTILWTVLGTIVVGILGYVSPAVKQALTAGGTTVPTTIPQAAATVATVLNDPAFKAGIEAALSRVISSGVPGTVLTAGAGLVPGAGPIVALLEPMIRAAIMDALATHTAPAVATATAPVTDQLSNLLSVVNGLKAQIEAIALPKVPA